MSGRGVDERGEGDDGAGKVAKEEVGIGEDVENVWQMALADGIERGVHAVDTDGVDSRVG